MIEEISVKDLGEIKEEYRIIDIRDEIEFRYGSIAGAVNIPLKEIKSAAKELDREALYTDPIGGLNDAKSDRGNVRRRRQRGSRVSSQTSLLRRCRRNATHLAKR